MSESPDETARGGDAWDAALRWRREGFEVALAIVLSARGSTPRGAGSALAVRADGVFVGSVSGGCVEAAAVEAALEVVVSGDARRVAVDGGSAAGALGLELECGGSMELLALPAPDLQTLERVAAARAERRPVVLEVLRRTGRVRWLDRAGDDQEWFDAAIAGGVGRFEVHEVGERLLVPLPVPRRLVVIGAVHITRALVGIAAAVGLELVVVEPREAFARSAAQWIAPPPTMLREWPAEALAQLSVDANTAVVALTHDAKFDDAALLCAAASPAFYVGALGSRRTAAARLERLAAAGLCRPALRRIAGPVGLAIGATSPEEIALSIVAELVSASHGAPIARPLPEGLVTRALVGAVVLAAGRSSRLQRGGLPKPALDVGGAPLVRRALDVARAAVGGPIVVTSAHEAVRAALAAEPDIEPLHDPALRQAMSLSLAAGVARLRGRADAALVLLADMPDVRPETARAVVARFVDEPALAAVVPVHRGRRGHPVLFAERAFERLLALRGDVGARAVLEELGDAVAEVTVDDPGVHFDVDDEAALAKVRSAS